MSGGSNDLKQEVRLPGFGRPVGDFPSKLKDKDGKRLRFPHAIADDCSSRGVTVRERRMMDFINKITDKPEWERKIFDEAIVAKWLEEGCVWNEDLNDYYLSTAMFDYVSLQGHLPDAC
jgi:hypothetical protein